MARIVGIENHGSIVLVNLELAGGRVIAMSGDARPTMEALRGLQIEADAFARSLALGVRGQITCLEVGYSTSSPGMLDAIWAEGYRDDLVLHATA